MLSSVRWIYFELIMRRIDSLDLYTIISKVIFNITIKNYNFNLFEKYNIIVMIFKILLYFIYIFFFPKYGLCEVIKHVL
jgi:hypothetical protein